MNRVLSAFVFQEVILPPNGSAQIQLEPIKIE